MKNDYYLSKQQIAQSFTQAASHYEQAAVLSTQVAEQLLDRLKMINIQPVHILDLGCGTGHITKQLQQQYPQAHITGIDIASGMIHYAQKHRHDEIAFICADAAQIPLSDQSVDMIFSNSVFHWCHDLNAVFAECRRVLKPNGLLMFTMLGPDTLKELRHSWAQVDDFPHVHAFFDMHDVGDCVLRNQFSDPVMDVEAYVLTYENVSSLMRDLKNSGEHNINAGRKREMTSKKNLQAMINAYEQWRTPENFLPATYEVIFGHAMASSALTTKNEVRIPVSQVRRI